MSKCLNLFIFSILTISPLVARGGGGGGGHGGRSYDGSRGYRENGHWNNHSDHYGYGGWHDYNYRGVNYYSWRGPYYYQNGWWLGGAFLVGFSFYSCNNQAIAKTNTWQICNDDVSEFKEWQNLDSVEIIEIPSDTSWPYRLCNNTSCVRARRAGT